MTQFNSVKTNLNQADFISCNYRKTLNMLTGCVEPRSKVHSWLEGKKQPFIGQMHKKTTRRRKRRRKNDQCRRGLIQKVFAG